MRTAIKMKQIVLYCSGRNELPPPGEFAVDMGNIQTNETVSAYKPVRSPERVAYRFLDGTESVEEIAGKIAETHPDVAVAFSRFALVINYPSSKSLRRNQHRIPQNHVFPDVVGPQN